MLVSVRRLALEDPDLERQLQQIEACAYRSLKLDFESAHWADGGFHYTRSASQLQLLMERYGATILIAWSGMFPVGYQIFFDEIIPQFDDDEDPEWGSDRWIDLEEWQQRGVVPDVYHYQIGVEPTCRKRGVGTALHKAFLAVVRPEARLATCETLLRADNQFCVNQASRTFHLSQGWKAFGLEMPDPGFEHPDGRGQAHDLVWEEFLLPLGNRRLERIPDGTLQLHNA